LSAPTHRHIQLRHALPKRVLNFAGRLQTQDEVSGVLNALDMHPVLHRIHNLAG
jgi:hypothetical protein